MKKIFIILIVLFPLRYFSQGFSTTASNWGAPNGGDITGGVTNGYNSMGGMALTSDNTGSQSWSVTDMNGDSRPDLVVTGQLQGGNVTSFSPASGQYWKVYLNTGSGFSTTATNWTCPNGGDITGGVTNGFNYIGGNAVTTDNTGSQSWSVADMNGDGKPDLVVTAQLQGGNVTSFSPTSGQYWKVYLNTGSGFSTTATNWGCPNGGDITGGVTNGFNAMGGMALTSDNTGSQSWSVADMNGDGKVDLVVTAQLQGGNVTSFSPTSGQYWKVYLNTGTGFSTTATNWGAPNGGDITGGVTNGFNFIGGTAVTTDNTGSQSWSVADMNGDGKPDLVITAQLQGGNVTSFSPTSGQYWKVYLNTGSGFSTTASNWGAPNGGDITGGVTNGFNAMGGMAVTSDNTGSQSWSVTDINGDGNIDLVVTAQLQGGNVTSFSPTSGQYWKVYLNTGTGFSTTASNWGAPNGGDITGGVTNGFNAMGGMAVTSDNTGSQSWSVADLNGDGNPDLVVTAQLQGGNVTSFSPTSGQYWKVYTNNSPATGIKEITGNEIFRAYPNPVADNLFIETDLPLLNIKYSIFDITGRNVKAGELKNGRIEMSALRPGVYFIEIGKSSKQIIKFVKQ